MIIRRIADSCPIKDEDKSFTLTCPTDEDSISFCISSVRLLSSKFPDPLVAPIVSISSLFLNALHFELSGELRKFGHVGT